MKFDSSVRLSTHPEDLAFPCPTCGTVVELGTLAPPDIAFTPWHLRNEAVVKEYVLTLGLETREWVLALYVDGSLNLLSVEAVGHGEVASVRLSFGKIICRGRALGAAGFFLVHNHPSGNATPSLDDIAMTRRLAHAAKECDLPLIRHYVISRDGWATVGQW